MGGTLVLAALLAACGRDASTSVVARPPSSARLLQDGTPGNFLVVVLDDVSVAQLEAYGARPGQARTPTLTNLAEGGILFRNAYGFPTCSPARAALLTGRYPSRYGIGNPVELATDGRSLPLAEITLPEALRASPHPYTSALAGKWHLATAISGAARFHPLDQGFDRASGSLEDLDTSLREPDGELGYTHWERARNGVLEWVDEYATTSTADDVVAAATTLREPWFVLAAFNAPHAPLHVPPRGLYTGPAPTDCEADPASCYNAMLEALDTEIGRMLGELPPDLRARTTIVVTADNGPPGDVFTPALDPEVDGRGTLRETGVHVPLIVSGAQVRFEVAGSSSSALVSVTDVFATVTELAEVPPLLAWDGAPHRVDAVSFAHLLREPDAAALPPRDEYVFAEQFWYDGGPPYARQERMVLSPFGVKLVRRDAAYDLTTIVSGVESAERLEGHAPKATDATLSAGMLVLLDLAESSLAYEGP